MAKTRAFLAIPLPETMIEKITELQNRLKKDFSGVRWSRLDNLHLTLRFFGDCSEEDLDKITKVMVSVGTLWAPFEVIAAGLGAFPSLNRPRVFWVGLQDADQLRSLNDDLETALAQVGIPKERRPFAPHLTLGRARRRISADQSSFAPYQKLECGVFPVDRMVLFASELHPGGAVHRPLETVLLGEGLTDPGSN